MAFELLVRFFSVTALKAMYGKKEKMTFFKVIIVSAKNTGTDCFMYMMIPVQKLVLRWY